MSTVVKHHYGQAGQELVYSLEVSNALGQTVAVVTVRESPIAPLNANELLRVRSLAEAAR